jgi:hypothetical protein
VQRFRFHPAGVGGEAGDAFDEAGDACADEVVEVESEEEARKSAPSLNPARAKARFINITLIAAIKRCATQSKAQNAKTKPKTKSRELNS